MYRPPAETAHREGALPSASGRAGIPVDPKRLRLALSRAKKGIVVTTLAGSALGAVLGKVAVPREFEATAILAARPVDGEPKSDGTRQVRTLADSVKLPTVLGRVREDLSLTTELESLGRDLSVDASTESDLLAVRAHGRDADRATELANAVALTFIDERLRIERARLATRLGALDDGVTRARAAFNDARHAYDQFRGEHGIADLATETHVAIEMAARLKSDQSAAAAVADAERARGELLTHTLKTEPMMTLLAEQHIDAGAQKLAELDAELVAEAGRLTAKHPKVQSLAASTRALRRGLGGRGKDVATARTKGRNPRWETLQQGLATSASEEVAATERRKSLEQMVARAQAEVTRLAAIEGRAAELLGETRQAEDHLREVEAMRTRAEEDARSAAADVSLVAPATRPLRPLKATGRMVALAVPAVLLFLATGVVVGRDLGGLRIFTPAEASFWGSGPVLAACHGAGGHAAAALALDLTDMAVAAQGSTLIVPIAAEDAPVAVALATALGGHGSKEPRRRAGGRRGPSSRFPVGDLSSASIRRQSRASARVLVIVASGRSRAHDLRELTRRLGRSSGIGFVLMQLPLELARCEDRVGDADSFFRQEPSRAAI